MNTPYYTTREVAKLVRRPRTHALMLLHVASVPHQQVGTAYLWSRDHVDELFLRLGLSEFPGAGGFTS